MNTKLIGALMVILLLWGGYKVFVYYKEVDAQRYLKEEVTKGKTVDPSKLPGMPYVLEGSLTQAKREGPAAMERWLKTYGPQLQDPRKAWIQLDYCQMLFRDDPQKARAVFASVKERLRENSPVYPRLKELEKSLE